MILHGFYRGKHGAIQRDEDFNKRLGSIMKGGWSSLFWNVDGDGDERAYPTI
jgi:hypothetical protein